MSCDNQDFGLGSNPIDNFRNWFSEAKKIEDDCESFTLSTVDINGAPNARTLLFKGVRDENFTFFTNYDSIKAKEIENNNSVAMTFFWLKSGQQIRIRGRAKKMSMEESKAYFKSRNYHSQVASYVSKQSKELKNRKTLVDNYQDVLKQYEDGNLPYPENWGGFLVDPFEMTFFIYGEYRLNDRFNFVKENGKWKVQRLYP